MRTYEGTIQIADKDFAYYVNIFHGEIQTWEIETDELESTMGDGLEELLKEMIAIGIRQRLRLMKRNRDL